MSYPTVELANRALLWANSTHKPRLVTEWMDQDDSSGHVECSCGWRSRSVKLGSLRRLADEHLAEAGEGGA